MNDECFLETNNKVEYMKSFIPDTDDKYIYHYTSSQGLIDIIESEKLRFSDRNFLNDRSEGSYVLDLLINNIDLITPNDNVFKSKLLDYCSREKDNLIKESFNTYQCSFSIDKDNLSLWNYYTKGDSIKGYNIKFDIQKLIASIIPKNLIEDKTFLGTLYGRVIYNEAEQIDILKKVIEYLYITYEKYKSESDEDVNFIIFALVFTVMSHGRFFKMDCFRVEAEYRIVFDSNIALLNKLGVDKGESFRVKNGYYIPYIDLKFSMESLVSITMSPTLDADITAASLERIIKSKRKRIIIDKSRIPVRY